MHRNWIGSGPQRPGCHSGAQTRARARSQLNWRASLVRQLCRRFERRHGAVAAQFESRADDAEYYIEIVADPRCK